MKYELAICDEAAEVSAGAWVKLKPGQAVPEDWDGQLGNIWNFSWYGPPTPSPLSRQLRLIYPHTEHDPPQIPAPGAQRHAPHRPPDPLEHAPPHA